MISTTPSDGLSSTATPPNLNLIYNSTALAVEDFTGDGQDVSNYSYVSVNYYCDVATTLHVQFSNRVPHTWTHEYSYSVLAATALHKIVAVKGRWCRILCEHTGVPATLRLYTVAHLTADRHLHSDTDSMLVTAVALPLPAGAATASKQDSQTALLTTLDADTSILAAAVTANVMQVNTIAGYALDATTTSSNTKLDTLIAILTTIDGVLAACVSASILNVALPIVGSQGNLWNAASPSAGTYSSVVDLKTCRNLTVFGTNTSQTCTLTLYISADNSTYTATVQQIFVTTGTAFSSSMTCDARYVKFLVSADMVSLTATLVAK
jgi:hypothetical protein